MWWWSFIREYFGASRDRIESVESSRVTILNKNWRQNSCFDFPIFPQAIISDESINIYLFVPSNVTWCSYRTCVAALHIIVLCLNLSNTTKQSHRTSICNSRRCNKTGIFYITHRKKRLYLTQVLTIHSLAEKDLLSYIPTTLFKTKYTQQE